MYYVATKFGLLRLSRWGDYGCVTDIREATNFVTWEAADRAGKSYGTAYFAILKA